MDTVAAYLTLAALFEDAARVQWDRPYGPRPVEDTTERSRGVVSDPTAAIALDPRRLALRDAVKAAESCLEDSRRLLATAINDLEGAMEAHGF